MLNRIIIQGRLGKEPELKEAKGKKYVAVPIAVQRDYKDDNGENITDWLDACLFGKTAETLSKFFRKGDMVILEGSLQTKLYNGKDDKQRKQFTVMVTSLYFPRAGAGEKKDLAAEDGSEDNLPF